MSAERLHRFPGSSGMNGGIICKTQVPAERIVARPPTALPPILSVSPPSRLLDQFWFQGRTRTEAIRPIEGCTRLQGP
jgi:hypothetical protein